MLRVVLSTIDIARMGNDAVWEFLRSKGMDMDKPVFGYPYDACNTLYGFAYEGTAKE